MSQSINLANVGSTNFNGATVDKINLNGSMIWEGFTAVNLFGFHGQLSGDKVIQTGIVGQQGSSVFGPDTGNPIRWATEYFPDANLVPSPIQSLSYKGYSILQLRTLVVDLSVDGAIKPNTPNDDPFGAGTLQITIAGDHPKDFFNSMTINGRVFHTAPLQTNNPSLPISANNYTGGTNIPNNYDPADTLTATSWKWELYSEATEYYVIYKNVNNIVEFR